VTFFSAIPVPETTIGIAIEETRGTPVAPAFWIPASAPKYKPDLQLLPDEGLRGSMVTLYDEVPGLRFDSHGWDAHPYMDSLPVLIRALLGSPDTKTVAPASTVLVAGAAAKASVIVVEATVAEGSYVVVGTPGSTIETHLVKKVTEKGAKEFELELAYPTAFKHPNGAAVTGLTKHQFSLLNNSPSTGNQPPSCTLTDFGGETNWRQLAAAQLDSLNISGTADSLPKAVTNWFTNGSITPEAPSPSFSSAEAPPGWTVQVAIGGTQLGYLVSWEFDLKRGVKNIPAITGTQNFYQHYAHSLLATAKITVLEDPAATWLTAYQNGTLESVDLTLSDVENGWAANFHSTKAKFITGDLDRSKEWVEVPLELQLIPSAADALAGGVSPLIVTVANGYTATY